MLYLHIPVAVGPMDAVKLCNFFNIYSYNYLASHNVNNNLIWIHFFNTNSMKMFNHFIYDWKHRNEDMIAKQHKREAISWNWNYNFLFGSVSKQYNLQMQMRKFQLFIIKFERLLWTSSVVLCCTKTVLLRENSYVIKKPKKEEKIGYLWLFSAINGNIANLNELIADSKMDFNQFILKLQINFKKSVPCQYFFIGMLLGMYF